MKKHSSPPKFALRLFRWFCDPELADHIEGDLLEEHRARSNSRGKTKADLKFFLDVLLLFRPGIIRSFRSNHNTNHYSMLSNYLKIALRVLARNKAYSVINISGLAVGLVAAIVIMLWVQKEMSFDSFHAKATRIHQLYSRDVNNGQVEVWPNTPALVAPELKQSYAEVEDAVRYRNVFFLLKVGENRFNNRGAFADAGYFKMFDFKFLAGTSTALDDEFGIVLTKPMAIKLFGRVNCLQETVIVNDSENFKVTGVIDLPDNTDFAFEYMLPWAYFTRLGWDRNQTWAWTNAQTFVLLKEQASIAGFDAKMLNIVKSRISTGDGSTREVFSQPLTERHLYTDAENGQLTGGRISTVKMFALIAVLILTIACINFMNLSTARSEKRAREVGVRKAIGALKGSLMMQFLAESFLLVFISFAIALIAVQFTLPLFNLAVNSTLSLGLGQVQFWVCAVTLILLTGLTAGSYPAFFLSSMSPGKALKNISRGSSIITTRQVLVVMQFTAAIVLSICAVTVQQQIQYAQNRNAGFNKQNLAWEFLQGEIPAHFDKIKNELLASGAVTSVTRTFSPIVRIWDIRSGMTWSGSGEADKSTNFLLYGADADMAKTFGMQITAGRDLDIYTYRSDTAAIMINEAAAGIMRLSNPVGEVVRDDQGRDWQIVGVVKDFVTESPFENISPMIIQGWQDRYGVVNYRFNDDNDIVENLSIAESVFKKNNPEYPYDGTLAEPSYDGKFATEKQTATLASLFAGLTIFISCLGLFGLSSYIVERRTKEIGIRKVLGASSSRITALLSQDFLKLVVVAIVVATPIAWYFMVQWLDTFTYRMPVSAWLFVVSGVSAVVIALVTVSFQTVKAATANPVNSLRSE